MFPTKRERRRRQLLKWTDADWMALDEFLVFPNHPHFVTAIVARDGAVTYEAASQPESAEWRQRAIEVWVDFAYEHERFADRLDRRLGLRTDSEDAGRNERMKVIGYWLTGIGIIIAGCGLLFGQGLCNRLLHH